VWAEALNLGQHTLERLRMIWRPRMPIKEPRILLDSI